MSSGRFSISSGLPFFDARDHLVDVALLALLDDGQAVGLLAVDDPLDALKNCTAQ